MTIDHPDYQIPVVPSMPIVGEEQVAWFQSDYKSVGAGGNEDLINYIVPDDYELHVCGGVVSGDFPCHQRYALRTTPAATWVSPTSHSDPYNVWSDEEKIYDGNIATYGRVDIPVASWSDWLYLLVNEQYINKIKFLAYYLAGYTDKIDIDVYYGDAWHDVYEGAFTATETEKDIPAGASLVSKARVRIHNMHTTCSLYTPFYEFWFNTSGVTAQQSIYFDTHAIIPYQPQAPYIVPTGATFMVRVFNDDEDVHVMTVNVAGFLQKKV